MRSSKGSARLFRYAGALVAAATLTMAGCGGDPGESQGGSAGGTLRVAVNSEGVALGYAPNIRQNTEYLISGVALETLGRPDGQGGMQPHLAEDWTTDPEAKTITFELREGVEFHDGSSFDARAVKWNIDQFLESGRPELKPVESVEVVDDHTVRLQLDRWNADMVSAVNLFVPMSSPTAFEENGEKWADSHPVGTGPFEFVDWQRDVSVEFTRFDGYWQEGKPRLDGVEFKVISDPTTAESAFRANEVDVYLGAPGQVVTALSATATVAENETGAGAVGVGVMMDSANPDSPFAELEVRKAVGHAIDRDAYVKTIMRGYGIATNQWGVPGAWSYNPDVQGQPYDPARAKQLLAEAGYPNGFATKLAVSGEDLRGPTAIQGYLGEVGIEVELETTDTAAWQEKVVSGGWDGLITWNSRGSPNLGLFMGRNFGADGPLYADGIQHPDEVEKLLGEISRAPDQDTRTKVAHELQTAVFEEHALGVPIGVSTMPAVKHPSVTDDGFNQTHGAFWRPADVRVT